MRLALKEVMVQQSGYRTYLMSEVFQIIIPFKSFAVWLFENTQGLFEQDLIGNVQVIIGFDNLLVVLMFVYLL